MMKEPSNNDKTVTAVICTGTLLFGLAGPQPGSESNALYGMYSGLALLMDVYYPEKPNATAWSIQAAAGTRHRYNAEPLKQGSQAQLRPLADRRGLHCILISHRAAPRFRIRAVEDAQRAVRLSGNAGDSMLARTGSARLADLPAAIWWKCWEAGWAGIRRPRPGGSRERQGAVVVAWRLGDLASDHCSWE